MRPGGPTRGRVAAKQLIVCLQPGFSLQQDTEIFSGNLNRPFGCAGVFVPDHQYLRTVSRFGAAACSGDVKPALAQIRIARKTSRLPCPASNWGDNGLAPGAGSESGILKGRPSGRIPRAEVTAKLPAVKASWLTSKEVKPQGRK